MIRLKRLFKKPEYFFQPTRFFKRVTRNRDHLPAHVDLPWGHLGFKFNPQEDIGRALMTYGLYDLVLTEALFRIINKDSHCVDVGANIGFYTSLMGHRGGQVTSFEPHPRLFRALKENSLNLKNIDLRNKALSNEKGSFKLYIPNGFSGNNGLASLEPRENCETFEVETETLDQIFRDQTIDVIKIDVEGHELSVLKGAEKLLSEKRIRHLLFEEFGGDKAPSLEFLLSRGYQVQRLYKGFFNLHRLDPKEGGRIPAWEPPNYIATAEPLDWSHFRGWTLFKKN